MFSNELDLPFRFLFFLKHRYSYKPVAMALHLQKAIIKKIMLYSRILKNKTKRGLHLDRINK